jgi:hypothetical protein
LRVTCGYHNEHYSDVATRKLPASYPQVSYLANPQLVFQVCQSGIGSIESRQGEAKYCDEVPTSPAVLNLENKHADAERLSSPRG